MDSFYTIVVVVALAVLIMVLIGIGIMLQKQNKDVAFPIYSTQCPDGWIVDTSNCVIPIATHPNFPKKSRKATGSPDMEPLKLYNGEKNLYFLQNI